MGKVPRKYHVFEGVGRRTSGCQVYVKKLKWRSALGGTKHAGSMRTLQLSFLGRAGLQEVDEQSVFSFLLNQGCFDLGKNNDYLLMK